MQSQQLGPYRTPIIPGVFAKMFMSDLWNFNPGDSMHLDVTFAVLPPGTMFATPDSKEVTSYKLDLTVRGVQTHSWPCICEPVAVCLQCA